MSGATADDLPLTVKDGKIGYVMTHRQWAATPTPNGEDACPKMNVGNREQFAELFPKDGKKRTVVEVPASAVVVLGGAWVGVPGEDLGIAKRDACVECIGDGGVAEGVRADVPWDAGGFRDAGDHSVSVSPVDGVSRHGT